MASLIFEGEFQDLSIKQIQFIRDVLEKRGFKENKVIFAPMGNPGDNYASDIKRITVELNSDDNFYVIAKVAPKVQSTRDMIMCDKIFHNEYMTYTKILPKYVSLQKAANVKNENILKYPECYGCLIEEPDELILLEDLTVSNYYMLDRLKPLRNDGVKCILKYFAVLHSLSYVLKEQEPDTYESLGNDIINLWNLAYEVPGSDKMWAQLEKDVIELLDREDYRSVIKGIIIGSVALNINTTNQDKDSMHSLLLHGDGWTNNAMFRLQDKELKECVMVDYQLSRKANPLCDILYMIFNCTDHETRAEHFHEWLNYYYAELRECVNDFGMDISKVYTKHDLNADIKRYSKIYLAIAIFILNVTLRRADEADKIKKAMTDDNDEITKSRAIASLSCETVSIYKSRIKGLIDSCKKFEFI